MERIKYIIFTVTLMVLASCEPTTVLDIKNEAEANLGVFSYPITQINYRIGEGLTPIPATLTDSGIFTYSVEPPLPPGILVNPVNGEISGVASSVTPRRTYTFKANLDKIGVEYRYNIAIEVTHIPPSNLIYTPANLNLIILNPSPSTTPTVTGFVDSFSIDPPLPAGLSFSTLTGTISGTPLIGDYEAIHFIKAHNPGGEVTTSMAVRIAPQPPVTATYSSPIYQCNAGTSCSISAPVIAPASATDLNFAITPALPSGYSFNPATGAITLAFGAKLDSSPATNHTISVFNDGGSTTTTINLETVVQPITSLGYLPTTITIDKDIHAPISLIPSTTPFYTPIDQFEIISSNLPDSLLFNNLTGEINGVTSQLAGTYNVTIRATNEVGFTDQTLQFVINEVPITGFTLTNIPNTFIIGQTVIPSIIPVYSGSLATHFTFEHLDETMSSLGTTLPSGVSWNSATGNPIGTPAELITGHFLRVRAHNGQGASLPVDIPFNISEPAPTLIKYENGSSDNSFNVTSCHNFNITPELVSGGTPISYAITPTIGGPSQFPPVPGISAGLSFDTLTGNISGNISEHYTGPKNFLVTATNPAGSTSVLVTLVTTPDIPVFSLADFSASRGITSLVTPIVSSCDQTLTPSISPSLPSEFSINMNNEIEYSGVLLGIDEYPSLVAKKSYTYSLSNASGSQSQDIKLELGYRLSGSNNFSIPIIVDFDSDGKNDIGMVQEFCIDTPPYDCYFSQFSILKDMNNSGEYSEIFSHDLQKNKVMFPAVFDLNQDTMKDVIYYGHDAGATSGDIIAKLQVPGATPSFRDILDPETQLINLATHPKAIHYADMNSDSIPDIFVVNDTDIQIYQSENTAIPPATPDYEYNITPIVITLNNFTNGLDEIALTHLNNDGIIDIVALKKDDNTLCPLIASGSSYPSTCSIFLSLPLANTQEIYAGDLNGDIYHELIVVSKATQTQLITIQNFGDSLATFTPLAQQIHTHNIEKRSLMFSDITGSANQDIIFWGEDFLTVLDGDALNNNTILPIERTMPGVSNLGGGTLYQSAGGLIDCSQISGDSECSLRYHAGTRL